MNSNEFDQRYPAMFQPGGEHIAAEHLIPVPLAVQVQEPAAHRAPARVKEDVPAPVAHNDLAEAEAEFPGRGPETVEHRAETPQASPPIASPWLLWGIPAALGLVMLVLGSLVLFIPQWVIPESDRDPSSYGNGSAAQLMFLVYTLAPAASPMAAGGLGVLAILFFFSTKARPSREVGLRRLFAITAGALVGLGLIFQFSEYLMPFVTTKVVDAASGQTVSYTSSSQFTMILMQLAPAPVLVGVLMLTALFLGRGMSNARWWLAGAGLLVASAVALFAPQLFPGMETSSNGGYPRQPWPHWLPVLAPTLVTAAVFTLMAAALKDILSAMFARARPSATRPAAQVGDHDEPWDDVDR